MSLSPRLVAIQGIEFTPVQIAVQGLLDYIAGGGKIGGRTTNTLKLRRQLDARQRLVGTKVKTRASLAHGRVTVAFVPEVVVPATGKLSGRRVSSACHPMRGCAGGAGRAVSTQTITRIRPPTASGGARSVARSASHASHASVSPGKSGGRAQLVGASHVTGWARTRGRGQKNLSTAQLAAIAVLYSDAEV